MSQSNDDPRAPLRRNVYALLILVGTGLLLGRILALDAVDLAAVQEYKVRKAVAAKKKSLVPRLIKKLQQEGLKGEELEKKLAGELEKRLEVEEAQLVEEMWLRRPFLSANDRSRWCTVRALVEPDVQVEGHPYAIDKVIQEPGWDTIDMVKHDDEGRGGLGPEEGHLYSSKPTLLPTLIAGEYWVIHRLTGMTLGTHPFVLGRFMLITVSVIPLLIYFIFLAKLIERFGTTDWGRMFVMSAAVFGTFLMTFAVTLNNHLPAAATTAIALWAAARIWSDGQRRLCYFLVVGFFAAFAAACELPALAFLALVSLGLLWKAPLRTLLVYVPAVAVVVAGALGTEWLAHGSLKPAYLHRNVTDRSDNWYDYSYVRDGKTIESYWNDPAGIDQGEPDRAIYAMHVLVGHHGIFSLTPVWLLSIAGAIIWLCRGQGGQRGLALLVCAVTAVILAFYLMRPEHHCNYGGTTSGLRWVFWLAPLWLLTMLPAADAVSSRWWTRAVASLMLVASVLSVSYPTWNPWTSPWLWDFLKYLG